MLWWKLGLAPQEGGTGGESQGARLRPLHQTRVRNNDQSYVLSGDQGRRSVTPPGSITGDKCTCSSLMSAQASLQILPIPSLQHQPTIHSQIHSISTYVLSIECVRGTVEIMVSTVAKWDHRLCSDFVPQPCRQYSRPRAAYILVVGARP